MAQDDTNQHSNAPQQRASNQAQEFLERRMTSTVNPAPEPAAPNKEWWQQPEHIIQTSVLLFVGAYTVLTFFILCSSQEQVRISRDAEMRQLRAYVYVLPPPKGVTGIVVDSSPSAVIAIRNSGQTPAYEAHMRGNIGLNAYPIGPGRTFREGPYGGAMVINPEAAPSIGGRVVTHDKFAQPDLDAIIDGENYRLYLFGTVIYKDAFGGDRTTNYCFAYFGKGPTLTQMDYCDQHGDSN